MAFGDVVEVIESFSFGATTIAATYVSETPAANDLNIVFHFTGAIGSNVDTAGYTEDQLVTNATEEDEGALYSQLVTDGDDDTVTCSSILSDEQTLVFALVRGAFASTPKDISDSSGRSTANPVTTGISSGDIAQADEVMAAIECMRIITDQTADWTRLGDAVPTTAMTEEGDIATNFKRVEAAIQVLTAAGTVGVSRANLYLPV